MPFEFKMWYKHKKHNLKLLVRYELQEGDDANAALAAAKAALNEVMLNPEDWEVWE